MSSFKNVDFYARECTPMIMIPLIVFPMRSGGNEYGAKSNNLKHLEDIHQELDKKITRHWEHPDSDDKINREKLENLSLKEK